MSPITKYFRCIAQAVRKFDKNIQIEATGGVEVVGESDAKAVMVPIQLWLPCYHPFTASDRTQEPTYVYPKTSDPFPVADAVREALDEAGVVGSDSVVVRMKDNPPPKMTRKSHVGAFGSIFSNWRKSKNHWEVEFLLPCPPPLVSDKERVLELCRAYKEEHVKNQSDGEVVVENPKLVFGEEIITGGARHNSSWDESRASVNFYRTRTAWYACSVKKSNGAVAHVIVRDRGRRARSEHNRRRTTADGYMLGRTLYCLKSCLVKNPDQWW